MSSCAYCYQIHANHSASAFVPCGIHSPPRDRRERHLRRSHLSSPPPPKRQTRELQVQCSASGCGNWLQVSDYACVVFCRSCVPSAAAPAPPSAAPPAPPSSSPSSSSSSSSSSCSALAAAALIVAERALSVLQQQPPAAVPMVPLQQPRHAQSASLSASDEFHQPTPHVCSSSFAAHLRPYDEALLELPEFAQQWSAPAEMPLSITQCARLAALALEQELAEVPKAFTSALAHARVSPAKINVTLAPHALCALTGSLFFLSPVTASAFLLSSEQERRTVWISLSHTATFDAFSAALPLAVLIRSASARDGRRFFSSMGSVPTPTTGHVGACSECVGDPTVRLGSGAVCFCSAVDGRVHNPTPVRPSALAWRCSVEESPSLSVCLSLSVVTGTRFALEVTAPFVTITELGFLEDGDNKK